MKRYRGFEGEVATLSCLDCGSDDCVNCPGAGLGFLRTQINGGREAYFARRRQVPISPTTEPIRATDIYQSSPKLPPPTEPAPVLEPAPVPVLSPYDPGWQPQPGMAYPAIPIYSANPEVRQRALELESRQYAEGGDGQAPILETTAKIDEAIKRATGGSGEPPSAPAPAPGKEMPNLLPLAIGAALIWIMR